jgi:hypothetical protein
VGTDASEGNVGREQAPDPKSRGLLDAAQKFGPLAGLAASAAAGVLYVLLAFSATRIYASLGVSTEDVGLGYGALLRRTAIGMFWLAAVFSWLLIALVFTQRRAIRALGTSKHPVLAMVALYGFMSILAWLYWWKPELWVSFIGAMLALVLLLYGAVSYFGKMNEVVDRLVTMAPAWFALALAAWIVALAGIAVFGVEAERDAQRLRSGRVPSKLFNGLPAPWDAQVVRVSWVDPPAPGAPSLPSCLLYLGQANGTSIFYDATDGHERAMRLPTSTVFVEVLPNVGSSLPSGRAPGPCA